MTLNALHERTVARIIDYYGYQTKGFRNDVRERVKSCLTKVWANLDPLDEPQCLTLPVWIRDETPPLVRSDCKKGYCIPDAWGFNPRGEYGGPEYVWIEIVDKFDISQSKMDFLYYLKDQLMDAPLLFDDNGNRAVEGFLRCKKYDLVTNLMVEFDPFCTGNPRGDPFIDFCLGAINEEQLEEKLKRFNSPWLINEALKDNPDLINETLRKVQKPLWMK